MKMVEDAIPVEPAEDVESRVRPARRVVRRRQSRRRHTSWWRRVIDQLDLDELSAGSLSLAGIVTLLIAAIGAIINEVADDDEADEIVTVQEVENRTAPAYRDRSKDHKALIWTATAIVVVFVGFIAFATGILAEVTIALAAIVVLVIVSIIVFAISLVGGRWPMVVTGTCIGIAILVLIIFMTKSPTYWVAYGLVITPLIALVFLLGYMIRRTVNKLGRKVFDHISDDAINWRIKKEALAIMYEHQWSMVGEGLSVDQNAELIELTKSTVHFTDSRVNNAVGELLRNVGLPPLNPRDQSTLPLRLRDVSNAHGVEQPDDV